MTFNRRVASLWWVAEAILLAISFMSAMMLLMLVLTRLLHWLDLISDYTIADLYLDDIETSLPGLAGGIVMPVVLVLLPRLPASAKRRQLIKRSWALFRASPR